MSNETKSQLILEMFASFPSFLANETEMAVSVTSYLRVLSGFPDEIVKSATIHFCKKKSPFPPSTGELFSECESRQIAARRAGEWERLGRPTVKFRMMPAANKSEFTLAQ